MTMRSSNFLVALVATAAITVVVASQKTIVCPIAKHQHNSTLLQTRDPVKKFAEVSGLAISPTLKAPSGEPIVYGINDGGGGERLGLWDSKTGQRLLTLIIPNTTFTHSHNINITNHDWESLTLGSCGSTHVNETCIYIADFGDNTARRSKGKRSNRPADSPYRILKMLEPKNLTALQNNGLVSKDDLSMLNFDYQHPSSPTKYADCEGMFLDPTGWGEGGAIGDLYLVPKWGGSPQMVYNRVFKIPASAWPPMLGGSVGELYSPEAVGHYPSYSVDAESKNVTYITDFTNMTYTRAEATYDGTVIALGSVKHIQLYLRCPGATVAEVLAPAISVASDQEANTHYPISCHTWENPVKGQMETFAWTPDGMRNLQVPEGKQKRQYMGWTTMEYNVHSTSQKCPDVSYNERGICRYGTKTFPNAWCDATMPPSPTVVPTVAPTGAHILKPTIDDNVFVISTDYVPLPTKGKKKNERPKEVDTPPFLTPSVTSSSDVTFLATSAATYSSLPWHPLAALACFLISFL